MSRRAVLTLTLEERATFPSPRLANLLRVHAVYSESDGKYHRLFLLSDTQQVSDALALLDAATHWKVEAWIDDVKVQPTRARSVLACHQVRRSIPSGKRRWACSMHGPALRLWQVMARRGAVELPCQQQELTVELRGRAVAPRIKVLRLAEFAKRSRGGFDLDLPALQAALTSAAEQWDCSWCPGFAVETALEAVRIFPARVERSVDRELFDLLSAELDAVGDSPVRPARLAVASTPNEQRLRLEGVTKVATIASPTTGRARRGARKASAGADALALELVQQVPSPERALALAEALLNRGRPLTSDSCRLARWGVYSALLTPQLGRTLAMRWQVGDCEYGLDVASAVATVSQVRAAFVDAQAVVDAQATFAPPGEAERLSLEWKWIAGMVSRCEEVARPGEFDTSTYRLWSQAASATERTELVATNDRSHIRLGLRRLITRLEKQESIAASAHPYQIECVLHEPSLAELNHCLPLYWGTSLSWHWVHDINERARELVCEALAPEQASERGFELAVRVVNAGQPLTEQDAQLAQLGVCRAQLRQADLQLTLQLGADTLLLTTEQAPPEENDYHVVRAVAHSRALARQLGDCLLEELAARAEGVYRQLVRYTPESMERVERPLRYRLARLEGSGSEQRPVDLLAETDDIDELRATLLSLLARSEACCEADARGNRTATAS